MKLIAAQAYCSDCEWRTDGLNAMGNAAQHHYKKNHTVGTELVYLHYFEKKGKEEKKVLRKGKRRFF